VLMPRPLHIQLLHQCAPAAGLHLSHWLCSSAISLCQHRSWPATSSCSGRTSAGSILLRQLRYTAFYIGENGAGGYRLSRHRIYARRHVSPTMIPQGDRRRGCGRNRSRRAAASSPCPAAVRNSGRSQTGVVVFSGHMIDNPADLGQDKSKPSRFPSWRPPAARHVSALRSTKSGPASAISAFAAAPPAATCCLPKRASSAACRSSSILLVPKTNCWPSR